MITEDGLDTLVQIVKRTKVGATKGECWIWNGSKNKDGYAYLYTVIGNKRKAVRVHRKMFELFVAPLDRDMVIDHLCNKRDCIHPLHLQQTTVSTNILRGTAPSALNAVKTHCKRGHEFTPENTYDFKESKWAKLGHRMCRTCKHLHDVKRQDELRPNRKRRKSKWISPFPVI